MSVVVQSKRVTVPEIVSHKNAKPVVCLTCYHAHTARLLDEHVDLMLVGDSVGMVMHGMETTLGVTLEMMILHGQAVMRGSKHALVVVDMPFGSYEESPQVAFRNAARMVQETGCQAVKLEGGERMAETVHYMTQRGIPVMGHIGLTPQRIQIFGGFKTQGRTEAEWPAIEADARAVADAGAFCRGARRHCGAPGGQDHQGDLHSHHRHRRVPALRRADPGDGRHAGVEPQPAQIRPPIRPDGP